MGIFDALRKTIADLGSESGKIRRKLESLRQEREEVEAIARPKEEAILVAHMMIDEEASYNRPKMAERLSILQSHGTPPERFNLFNLLTLDSREDISRGLSVLMQGELKAALAAAIEQAHWPKNTMTAQARDAKLKQLDKAIESLEKDLADLVREAHRAGVSLNV